jgi:deoxyribodipyrimidine photo-lyase
MSDTHGRERRRYETAIVWLRRDLRLHDHPALVAALAASERVVPLFVFDDALLGGRWPAPNRLWFMRECVRLLGDDLRARGGGLALRRGLPAAVVPAFAAEVGAEAVFVTRDYGPYARRRDHAVADALAGRGVRFHAKRGLMAVEPEEVLANDGRPYTVYGPYRRKWAALPRRAPLATPERLPDLAGVALGALPALEELGARGPAARDIPAPGERAARARLDAWTTGGVERYAELRDLLAADGTSRLSQDLHWGLLSPVEVLARCDGPGEGRRRYAAEIAWRDFYYQVLFHHPQVVREPFQGQFKALAYRNDPAQIAAWQEGRTGYPIVDAAMRQVVACGWMHNRARMIVASFLTKSLLVDGKVGERFFMAHLTDGDLASNDGGWQWAASTGTDPQPYFRIFNPTAQGKRHDPELARVPEQYIHAPWTMPAEAQREAGCVIGRDYPAPIVEHGAARALALATYGQAAEDGKRVTSAE